MAYLQTFIEKVALYRGALETSEGQGKVKNKVKFHNLLNG